MPGPVHSTVTGFSGGAQNVARAEPVCMAMVGAVAVRWTEVETSLEVLLATALAPAWLHSGGGVGTEINWVARVAMKQAETIRTRLKLIESMIVPLIRGSRFESNWREIEKQLRARSKERNEIVHAEWKIASELPGKIIRSNGSVWEQWGVADFKAVLSRFHKLAMAIAAFQMAIGEANARNELPTIPGPP